MAVQAVARLRYVSIPPRKMRQVTELVKGLPVENALNILNFTPKIAARHVAKTLKSAAANALSLEGTSHLHPEDLFVKEILVQPAPAYKRVRFQSMGRVFRYKKRHCHLTIKLEERPHREVPTAAAPAGKNAKTKKASTGT
ncbi:MAG: 50S ribosomal protein L22, partial [Candidatus Zixiibacteriota bacterium]